jgi:hypothetical protein
MTEPDELWRYATRATAGISSRADRRAARSELHEHALARYEDALGSGSTPQDALRDTLARLGDPTEYAADLRRASRSSMGPRNLTLVIAASVLVTLIVIALIAWFFWANGAYHHY